MFVSNQNQPHLIGIPDTTRNNAMISTSTSSSFPQQLQQQQQQYGTNGLEIGTFYIVQKCWYSGPKTPLTVDYLRLLPSIAQAEQVAYQSAHTYASVSTSGSSSSSSSSSKNAAVVRTIQIPVHHYTNGPSAAATNTTNSVVASSYGFVANGLLFWIRRINVWVSAGVPVNSVVDSAHCIVSNGVIGIPDSNNSSYRTSVVMNGNEQIQNQQPCAFVGPAGYAWALQQSASGKIPIGATCQWIPVGKPNFDNITGEWPDRHEWNNSTTITSNAASTSTTSAQSLLSLSSVPEISPITTKRVSDNSQSDHYWFSNTTNTTNTGAVTSSSEVSDLDDSYRGISYTNNNCTTTDDDDVAMDTEDNSENDGGTSTTPFDYTTNRMFISQPASKRRCYNHRDSLTTTATTTTTTSSSSTFSGSTGW